MSLLQCSIGCQHPNPLSQPLFLPLSPRPCSLSNAISCELFLLCSAIDFLLNIFHSSLIFILLSLKTWLTPTSASGLGPRVQALLHKHRGHFQILYQVHLSPKLIMNILKCHLKDFFCLSLC